MPTLREVLVGVTRERITVMQAFVDGKIIEVRASDRPQGDWVVIDNPSWDWYNFNYRVRP